ncbi:uncharacterized protein LOC126885085 [Diabrotica virgifera virgifera]|uniref:Uncharacterized protein n=1 Tax=Diabrotica virgifera virgifera TaxID=50390 RepID=A0ABM5KB98_DIAVI|nr:uncharacterized protein LOC126885085 [Diabrotica virgifera virgifera]
MVSRIEKTTSRCTQTVTETVCRFHRTPVSCTHQARIVEDIQPTTSHNIRPTRFRVMMACMPPYVQKRFRNIHTSCLVKNPDRFVVCIPCHRTADGRMYWTGGIQKTSRGALIPPWLATIPAVKIGAPMTFICAPIDVSMKKDCNF